MSIARFVLCICRVNNYIAGLILASALFVSFLFYSQDSMLYLPNNPSTARTDVWLPYSYDLPYQEHYLKTSDNNTIHSYFILQPKPQRKTAYTLLFFHGNAGNIGHRLPNAKELFNELQINILLIEYRGYGLSTGVPNEKGKFSKFMFTWLI